ncbi:MAG: hypothetical protein HYU97_11825 [Deltaproteobacteria bacterium]|nr:hypothetical protein [Deltaproteobacteria bacterium]
MISLLFAWLGIFSFNPALAGAPDPTLVCKISGTIMENTLYAPPRLAESEMKKTPLALRENYVLGILIDKVAYVRGDGSLGDCQKKYPVETMVNFVVKKDLVKAYDSFSPWEILSGEVGVVAKYPTFFNYTLIRKP